MRRTLSQLFNARLVCMWGDVIFSPHLWLCGTCDNFLQTTNR